MAAKGQRQTEAVSAGTIVQTAATSAVVAIVMAVVCTRRDGDGAYTTAIRPSA